MLIQLNKTSRNFECEGKSVAALRNVSLELAEGGLVCIQGPSGAGKTTLLRILGLLDRPTSGSYQLSGQEVRKLSEDGQAILRRHVFGFVFQESNLLDSSTALENVELPGTYARLGRHARKNRADGLLSDLGLAEKSRSYPAQLSGGEQQRVAIARALMNGGRVILADEPTGSLDRENAKMIVRLLERLSRNGHTVILASHDRNIADRADRLIELRDGTIVGDSAASRVTNRSSAQAKGRKPSPSRTPGDALSVCPAGWASIRSMLLRKIQLRVAMLILSVAVGIGLAGMTPIIAMGTFRDAIEEANVLGLDAITVLPFNFVTGSRASLTFDDARAIENELPEVRAVSPEIFRHSISARHGTALATVRMLAFVDQGSRANRGRYSYRMESGTGLSLQDNDDMQRVAVICSETRRLLFPPEVDPTGEDIFLENERFRVKGVLRPFFTAIRGSAEEEVLRDLDSAANSCVLIPPSTAVSRLPGNESPSYLHVYVHELDQIAATSGKVRDLLIRRHGQEGFSLSHKATQIAEARRTRNRVLFGFGSLASVALLASGLSVAAAMLTTVTARRREIGIRKALGAGKGDIYQQFLLEALVLTAIGGILGLLLCLTLMPILQSFGVSVAFSPWYLAAPLIGAVGLGLICGVQPAARAARLDPSQALAAD